MFKTKDLLDINHTIARHYFDRFEFPWEILANLHTAIIELGKELDKNEYEEISENIWIHKKSKIALSASISSPCIIGANTEVRHCAFIRGNALIGDNCVVGNSTELKKVILFDNVQVPHFNYVGDSILGYKAHLGAGAITSNVKSDKSCVLVKYNTEIINTGLNKLGAILGDSVEVGCNSVLNPGTIIGKNTNIYPVSCVRGFIPSNCIYKDRFNIIQKIN